MRSIVYSRKPLFRVALCIRCATPSSMLPASIKKPSWRISSQFTRLQARNRQKWSGTTDINYQPIFSILTPSGDWFIPPTRRRDTIAKFARWQKIKGFSRMIRRWKNWFIWPTVISARSGPCPWKTGDRRPSNWQFFFRTDLNFSIKFVTTTGIQYFSLVLRWPTRRCRSFEPLEYKNDQGSTPNRFWPTKTQVSALSIRKKVPD